jgi:hypothetical protein
VAGNEYREEGLLSSQFTTAETVCGTQQLLELKLVKKDILKNLFFLS